MYSSWHLVNYEYSVLTRINEHLFGWTIIMTVPYIDSIISSLIISENKHNGQETTFNCDGPHVSNYISLLFFLANLAK